MFAKYFVEIIYRICEKMGGTYLYEDQKSCSKVRGRGKIFHKVPSVFQSQNVDI